MANINNSSSHEAEQRSGSTYSDEEEEEEEPKLKYERLNGDLNDILKKDTASCVCINDKLIVLGTNWGRLHILDHQGNQIRQLQVYSSPVTMLSMDDNGDYIASCSHEKKVIVQGLFSNDYNHSVAVDFPVKAIALDPNYGKLRSARRFIIGDHRVTLYEKGRMFASSKATVLNEGTRGTGELVRGIKWSVDFLAWASDSSVKIMHTASRVIVSLIKRDHSLALGSDQYPPHICWKDEKTLLIGWGDSVKVCRIRKRVYDESIQNGLELPPYIVEIVYMFTTDFYICGLGPLDDLVVVLAYNKRFGDEVMEKTERSLKDRSGLEWRRPQMRVLLPLQGSFEEVSKDILAIRAYQDNHPNNYHLEHLKQDRRFYVVCPQDFVIAKPREAHDRIQWLLNHQKFHDALEIVDSNGGKVEEYTSLSIGTSYIEHLLVHHQYEQAAALSARIFRTEKSLWEENIMQFMSFDQLPILCQFIPVGGRNLLLKPSIYQTVVSELLDKDHEVFLFAIKSWPKNLYDIPVVINKVLGILTQNTSNLSLLRALAHLYSNIGKHDKALAIYLKLQDTDIFGLIVMHTLWSCVPKHIVELMNLDAKQTLNICSSHASVILPDKVVTILVKEQEYLYQYLNMLYERHSELSTPYHNQLLRLYAIYNRSNILSLLRASPTIDLQPALKVTKEFNLSKETVYLLVRMGNTEAALRHLLEKENDIDGAIKICKEHSDADLWLVVIKHSMSKPSFICELLNHIGAHVDPLLILRWLPKDMEIPDLRNALIKILHDFQLKICLHQGYQKIVSADNVNLLEKEYAFCNAGIPVQEGSECSICCNVVCSLEAEQDIVVFGCRHAYHVSCLQEKSDEGICIVCHASKKLIPS